MNDELRRQWMQDQAALVKLHQALIDASEAVNALSESAFHNLCLSSDVDFSPFVEGPTAFDPINEMIAYLEEGING